MRIVYTAGVMHSGSTLLNLMLGAHPRVKGIGEAAHVVHRPERFRPRAGSSPLWTAFYDALDRDDPGHPVGRYQLFCSLASVEWGADVVLNDSSKTAGYLRAVLSAPGVDVRALLLARDYRSWVVSRRAKLLREEGPLVGLVRARGIRLGLGRARRRGAFSLALRWARENGELQEALDASGVPFLRVGYEQLCFDPELRMREICRFLDLEFDPRVLQPAESRSQIIEGNRMRDDPAKLERIRYDDRWLYRREWVLLPVLLPRIDRLNAHLVYGRGQDSVFEEP